MSRDLDCDFSDILEAHVESAMHNDDDLSYRVAKDSLKGRYLSNKYLDDEDVDSFFDDYE